MAGKRKKLSLLPILILGLLLVLFAGFAKFKKGEILTETPKIEDDWKSFKSEVYGFEFRYPPQAKLGNSSSQYTAVSFMGEKQIASGRTQTEIFDGYIFNVAEVPADGAKDLGEFYKIKESQLKDICTKIEEPKEFGINGINGLTHRLSCLGDYEAYYFEKDGKFFEMGLLYVGEKEDVGSYKETVYNILSTFKFTK